MSKPSLTHRTARGFFWLAAQSGAGQFIDIFVWFALASLLLKEELGVVSIALATRVFTDILNRAGLRQVLVQRHLKFDRWATPCFWLSLTIGLLAGLVMCISAPIITNIYDQPDLLWLTIILAATPAVGGITTVPFAKMQADLRFRGISVVEFGTRVIMQGLRVGLALAGYGPFACVIPEPIAELIRACAFWWLARPRIRWRLRLRRWKYLLADSAWLLIGSTALKVVAQAPYFICGLFLSAAALGDYFLSFSLSVRALRLVTANMENVLLPALSHIQAEAKRQVGAYIRATRMLATIAAPACLFEAALVDPVVRLLAPGGKWDSAIPVAQILAAGITMWILQGPTASLMKAQGRWALFAGLSSVYACFFAGCVFATAFLSEQTGIMGDLVLEVASRIGLDGILGVIVHPGSIVPVAVTVALCMGIYAPIQVFIAIRPGSGKWADVRRILVPPILQGVIAITFGITLASLLPDMPFRHGFRIVVITMGGGGLYLLLLRTTRPQVWRALLDQIGSILGPMLKRLHPSNTGV